MSDVLLDIRNLVVTVTTRRSILHAVDDLTLSVNEGEILGLVGESGAGKSMTGSAILGLIEKPVKISGGEIWFKGKRIDQYPEQVRGRKISMIFQDPLVSLNPLKRIGDQLIETITTHMNISHSDAVKRAQNCLIEVGIDPDRMNAYPHTFSGGMRQRVVIALALAPEPSLVIADEPTTALDVSIQAQILDLLKKICRDRGTSIILITHDMGVIAQTTDRVCVMYSGRLAEIGKTADILTNPKHPYTKGLVASTPRIDASSFDKMLYQIPGSMPALDNVPPGCAFHPRCEHAMDKCRIDRPEMLADRAACWLLDGDESSVK